MVSRLQKKYEEDVCFESIPHETLPGFFTSIDNRSEREKKDFGKCCERSDQMEQQDIDMLTKMINKYIGSWWD